jgi:hypothetical protein
MMKIKIICVEGMTIWVEELRVRSSRVFWADRVGQWVNKKPRVSNRLDFFDYFFHQGKK